MGYAAVCNCGIGPITNTSIFVSANSATGQPLVFDLREGAMTKLSTAACISGRGIFDEEFQVCAGGTTQTTCFVISHSFFSGKSYDGK